MAVPTSFVDLVRHIGHLARNDGPELHEPLPLADALAFKYRGILSRSPDRFGLAHARHTEANATLARVSEEGFASDEFIGALPFHLDRLRAGHDLPVIWHLHLPRTAGSKLKHDWYAAGEVLVEAPPPQQVVDAPYWHAVVERLLRFSEAAAAGRRALVTGHMAMAHVDRYVRPGDAVIATVRDPVQRALSTYRYARQMCRNGSAIIGMAGREPELIFYGAEWRQSVAAHGLDPDAFGLREFVASGLVPDGQLALFLCPDPQVEALDDYVANAGIRIAGLAETAPDAGPGRAVNRTRRDPADEPDAETIAWMHTVYVRDLLHYRQLQTLAEPIDAIIASLPRGRAGLPHP